MHLLYFEDTIKYGVTVRNGLYNQRMPVWKQVCWYLETYWCDQMSKRKKMKIHQRLSEKVRGKIDENIEAEITWEQLILVCQIANGAFEFILFFLYFIQNYLLW